MIISTRISTRALPAAILAMLVVSSTVTGQTRPEERNRPPVVTLVDSGEGVPVLLRWRAAEERVKRTTIVSAQTAPSTVPRPSLNGKEPDVVLRGLTRPPIEKIWTISGGLSRNDAGVLTAQWRVVDGAARLTGVEGLARARAGGDQKESVEGAEAPEDGVDGGTDTPATDTPATDTTKPATPSGLGRPDPREDSKKLTGTGTKGRQNSIEGVSTQQSLDKAMQIERIADEAVGRTGGSTIQQTLSEGGLDPTSLRVRLLQPDRRAEYEMQTLLEAMRLAEAHLPNQPVAPGASWKAGWNGLIMNVPVRSEVTWTLVGTDEAAKGTNIAQTATLRMKYQRRLLDPKGDPSPRERLLEADGQGRLVIRLDEPMTLEARLVEQPIQDPGNNRSRMVTRYRLDPVENP